MYDLQEIVGVRYYDKYGNITDYEYIKDAHRNVIGIVKNNSLVVKYTYDAWGNTDEEIIDASDPFVRINPIRYRSYYYDIETGYYYLQSRYYDPEIGAFISADTVDYLDPETIGGLNLYSYCLNNPVMYIDPSGNFCLLGFILGVVIGASIGFGVVAYMDYQDDGKIFNGSIGWQTYLGATLFGGAVGGILGGYVLPALSHMSFSIPTGLNLLTDTAGVSHFVVTSAVTITGGQVIAGAGTLAALGGLTYMFAKIPYQGEPNTTVKQGGSYGEYDSNGNLKYRVDTKGKAHYIKKYGKKYLPHIHKFTWKIVDGVWRFIEEIFPYL